MKFWFTFGSGLVLGTITGAFLAATFLFDDAGKGLSNPPATKLAQKAVIPSPAPTPVVVHTDPAKAPPAVAVETTPEEIAVAKPVSVQKALPAAVSAEAVDFDSLPVVRSDEIISTASRDQTPDTVPVSVH